MNSLDADALAERLKGEMRDYWLHIEADSPLEKYPAKHHAQRVAERLNVDNGLIYLPGMPTILLPDSDQPQPFRQLRYFYYLSGVNEPDCHITYDISRDILTLWIPEITPRQVIWFGRGSTIAEAFEKYDVDDVGYSSEVDQFLGDWLKESTGKIYTLHQYCQTSSRHDSTSLKPAMDACRVIKTPDEINLIKRANEITAHAHKAVLSNISSFRNETEVEAVFLDACISEGAKHQAYKIIAASGENASTLHYVKNDEPLEGRQLMCLDAGCEWHCYASDVTRTFPFSDSWPSAEGKNIYDLVSEIQRVCIANLKPGVRFFDVHILAHRKVISGLKQLGIFHNGTDLEIFMAGTSLAFFPHGLGHHVGLEVHDVSDVPLMAMDVQCGIPVYKPDMCKSPVHPSSGALREGMVVTVEPGIYFSRYALSTVYLPSPIHSKYINKDVLVKYLPVGGVRIEDDILITANGHENLTTAPKGDEMLQIIRSGMKNGFNGKERVMASGNRPRRSIPDFELLPHPTNQQSRTFSQIFNLPQ
ncbi:hypothetical protein M501DRAFT_924957 [Patellaria atrata CBS 101060]|uniref:Xaa-Pro aminopeptidase n=1 Tax=Patellaria atrata CBS 101060 TaxID=1346257 RepID=A0A9P4SJF3_9PEZI|nr:hypothetical protein M501DRAFT_924957 [Patellaria atrata CBS 101060]